jgi:hypothetical protein
MVVVLILRRCCRIPVPTFLFYIRSFNSICPGRAVVLKIVPMPLYCIGAKNYRRVRQEDYFPEIGDPEACA